MDSGKEWSESYAVTVQRVDLQTMDGIDRKTEPVEEGHIARVMDKIRRPDTRRRNSFSLASDIFARTIASTSRSEISAG